MKVEDSTHIQSQLPPFCAMDFKHAANSHILNEAFKMNQYSRVVAIDGPSGSGKSTVARALASELGLLYIDTGAMFRALATYADSEGIEFKEGPELFTFLARLKMEYGVSDDVLIVINGRDLTKAIREHRVSKLASIISQLPSVRTFLLEFQRDLAGERLCVMEGRDIGTVVFPKAFIKFFVTASVETRAVRRLEQLRASGDGQVDLEQVVKDVKKRDETDMNRQVAPLKQASDAELVDTTEHTQLEIVRILAAKVRTRLSELSQANA